MITKDQLATAGANKLSDIILSLYEQNPALQKQLNIIFSGLDENPKKLIATLKKEISSLKRSRAFIDYYAHNDFVDRINQLRLRIKEDLADKSPKDALILMHSFLDLHAKTIERVDDSNGAIGDVFRDSCQDLGDIYTKVPKPVEEITQAVFDLFIEDDYCICSNVIMDFKNALKDEGLHLLYLKLITASSLGKSDITLGLKNIADCQKDIKAYIKACAFKNGEFSDRSCIEIATRLIDDWKASEALDWLNKVDVTHQVLRSKVRSLKINALELNGDYSQAEKERILWFDETLSPSIYGEILSNAKPEFKESFKKTAVEKAFNFSEPHTSIDFLIKAQEFEACGKFVCLKIDQLRGGAFYTLRPAAKILHQIAPLPATLLYRKMIEPVLNETKSKYYNYAARDLVSCSVLNDKIVSWQEFKPHNVYFQEIQESHKRKISFWPQYQSALEKQAKKAAKE